MVGAGPAIAAVINSYNLKSKQNVDKYVKEDDIKPSALSTEKQIIIDAVEREISDPDQIKSERICPECRKNFSLIKVNDLFFDSCSLCHSLWCDFGELKQLTGLQDDIPAHDLKEKLSQYPCPVCGELMYKKVFMQKSNLIVDVCIKHGIYLEKDELKRALEISEKFII